MRLVKPLPGPVVALVTMLAPKSRSLGFVVVAEPLLLVVPLPRVRRCHIHRAVRIRTSVFQRCEYPDRPQLPEKVTVTVFVPAAAGGNVLGIVNGLRQRAAMLVGPTARV